MRPLKLSFQSFGSYADKAVVDFDRPELNMFLISGDTGAGKSTIFDALCYALYGSRSSSGNQKPDQIQSQYAGANCAPFVELDFQGSDGRFYRIRRVPAHERSKRRGEGTVRTDATVKLTTPEGELTRASDVKEKIEELVGLTKDQFTQVALIAQGEFMRILSMDTTKRKAIFQKLFDTSIYERIAARVKDVFAESEKNLKGLRESLRQDASGFRVPADYARKDAFDDARNELLEKTDVPARIAAFLTETERLVGWSGEQREAADEQARRLRRSLEEAVKAYEQGAALGRRFADMDAAKGQFQELQSQLQEIDDDRVLAQRIEDAWRVSEKHDDFDRERKRAAELEHKVQTARESLPQLQEKAERLESAKRAAHDEQMRVNSECELTLEKVQAARRLLNEYEEAQAEQEREHRRLDSARRKANELETLWDASQRALTSLKDRADALAGAAERWSDWRVERQEARGLEDAVAAYEKEFRNWQKRELELRRERARRENAEAAGREAQAAFEKTEQALKGAEAARLAKYLKPGEPCPVCGSADHPHPYLENIPENSRRLIEQADELEKKNNEARVALQTAAKSVESAEEAQAEATQRAREAIETVKERYDVFCARYPQTERREVNSKNAGQVVRDLVSSLDAREKSLREDKDMRDQIEARLDQETKKAQELKDQLAEKRTLAAKSEAALEGRTKAVSQARDRLTYTDRSQADEDARAARKRKEDADRRAREAQTEADTARAAAQKTEQEIRTNEENLDRRRQDMETTRLSYEAAMQERSLSEEEWQRCVRKHSRSEAKQLRDQIASFDERLIASRQKYTDRLRDVEGKERPDLQALAEAREDVREQEEAATARLADLTGALQTNRAAWERARDLAAKSEKAAREYAVAYELNGQITGRTKGGNMDLEAFAQRQYLEAVLRSANERLRRMAQYELQTIPMNAASAAGMRNQGLDLRVLSLATGKVRDVSTLSGGESFMAALCMALGLADQIERNSAAVRLDFLFLDEGFGSLDKKACREAIRVLEETVGENRMVGVISHVETLRETIPDQLLVTKDLNGSHLKWKE